MQMRVHMHADDSVPTCADTRMRAKAHTLLNQMRWHVPVAVLVAEMRETLEQVESDNNDLTFQALEAIWKGSISGGNAGSFAGAAGAPRDSSSLSAGPGHQDNVRADDMLAATSRAEPGSLGAPGAASAGSPTVSRQSASATGGCSEQTAGGPDASTASAKVKAASFSRGAAPRAQAAADESVAEATRRIVAAMLSQFDSAGAAHAQQQACPSASLSVCFSITKQPFQIYRAAGLCELRQLVPISHAAHTTDQSAAAGSLQLAQQAAGQGHRKRVQEHHNHSAAGRRGCAPAVAAGVKNKRTGRLGCH